MASRYRLPARLALLAAVSFALLMSGCTLALLSQFKNGAGEESTAEDEQTPGDGLAQITSKAASVTLAWDSPTDEVSSYQLFYRPHGEQDWIYFTEIPASSDPTISLQQSDFGNGSFDFGVVAVTDTGAESPLHSSLDHTAQPTSGWYLTWDL
jgi:hypothetical protein